MGFGNKQTAPRISGSRLAAVAGGGAAAAPVGAEGQTQRTAAQRSLVEPDLSRIKPRGINETEEERKRRLAAKTVNFTATFIARAAIIAAAIMYGKELYESTGAIHRGVAAGVIAMCLDYCRVIMKAMEPGTK